MTHMSGCQEPIILVKSLGLSMQLAHGSCILRVHRLHDMKTFQICISKGWHQLKSQIDESKTNWTWLQIECADAIRSVMDSRIGLDYIVENREYVAKLASALDTANTTVKKQVFELLSALCVYNADGYSRTLDALEHFKNLKGKFWFFSLFIISAQFFCPATGHSFHSFILFRFHREFYGVITRRAVISSLEFAPNSHRSFSGCLYF